MGGAQDRLGPAGDDHPGVGRERSAGSSVEESHPELAFEMLDSAARRRLADPMGGRRPRHTAELDHRNEEVERCEFGERRRQRHRDTLWRDRARPSIAGPDVDRHCEGDTTGFPPRQRQLHRLSRLHRRLQKRARRPPRGEPHLGEIHRDRYVPRRRPQVLGDAMQPVRRRAVHEDLPDLGALSGRERRRRLPGRQLHRVQVVHERLPVRRAVHQPRDQHGAQVQHVQPPHRDEPRAVVSDRVSDRGDQDR